MMKHALLLVRKPLFIAAGVLAFSLASWSCKHKDGARGDGPCMTDPELPDRNCDPDGDISTECPLPETVSVDDDSYTTVYYYSDPSCVSGKCQYCMTSTTSEDPNATGAP